MKTLLLMLALYFSVFDLASSRSFAAGNPTPSFAHKNNVMDFEAEIIDGEKRAPEMFLQLETEKAEINTILYDRRDFNDFAPIHTLLRPIFSEVKKSGGSKK